MRGEPVRGRGKFADLPPDNMVITTFWIIGVFLSSFSYFSVHFTILVLSVHASIIRGKISDLETGP